MSFDEVLKRKITRNIIELLKEQVTVSNEVSKLFLEHWDLAVTYYLVNIIFLLIINLWIKVNYLIETWYLYCMNSINL